MRRSSRALEDITALTPVLAQIDDAAWVESALASVSSAAAPWRGETFVVHALADPDRVVAIVDQPLVRMLRLDDALEHLPPDLRHEMTHARLMGPVAAVFADGLAASFCYPCWQTERLWDVSIDTLDEHRGKSFAAAAVRLMIHHMRREGRAPVWGALESNGASLRLAARLGFVPVDRMVVFSLGHWALLTGPERWRVTPAGWIQACGCATMSFDVRVRRSSTFDVSTFEFFVDVRARTSHARTSNVEHRT